MFLGFKVIVFVIEYKYYTHIANEFGGIGQVVHFF